MSLSVMGSNSARNCVSGHVRDAPAQDVAVRVRVGDPPARVERCVEVRGRLPRERDRSLDRRRVAIHDCGNE